MVELRTEILRTLDQLAAIEAPWQDLWLRSHGSYFLSFASCVESWKAIHQPLGRRLACAVLRQDQEIVAILPMVCWRKQGLWTVAQTMGPDAAEGSDILVAHGAPPALAIAVLGGFLEAARPDILDLDYVFKGSALDVAVLASKRYVKVAQVAEMPCANLAEERDWASFERSLSNSYQRITQKQARRLEAKGRVEYQVITGQADESIDWLLDTKQHWGEKVHKQGPWLTSPYYRAYLKSFASTSGLIVTYVIKLDGAPAAVKVVFVGPTLCAPIIAAYDDSLSYFSPGKILDGFYIRHVFENFADPAGKPLNIEFGVGLELNKQHWSRGHKVEAKTYKVAATRWGALPYRIRAAVDRLKQRRAPVLVGEPSLP